MTKAEKLVEWFEMAQRESFEYYVEDIRNENAFSPEYANRLAEEMAEADCRTEEEFVDKMCQDDAIEWYVGNFGSDDFGKACLVALGYKTWNDFR